MAAATKALPPALVALREQRRARDRAEALMLVAAVGWADQHRVESGWGALDEELTRTGSGATPGGERELRLAGQGTFAVSEFAVAEVAVACELSEYAARRYLGQAMELRDRLPLCWAQVQAGTLPAWKGRRVAEQTIVLSPEAATWVDRQVAPFAARISQARLLDLVEAAMLRFDPDLAAERAVVAAEGRGVWVDHLVDGTSEVRVVTGTPDAVGFDRGLDEVAGSLAALGDTDPVEVRRAKAVGVLADPQYALAVHAAALHGRSALEDPTDQVPAVLDPAVLDPAVLDPAVLDPAVRDAAHQHPGRQQPAGPGNGARNSSVDRSIAQSAGRRVGAGDGGQGCTPAGARRVALHLHLHLPAPLAEVREEPTALVRPGILAAPGGRATVAPGPVVRVDGVGPRARRAVEQWLADLAPGARVTLTPVVDLTEQISVEAYEVPRRLHDQVGHRDTSCRFPWCGRRGRFDLDHIQPWVAPDSGGPPGQTSTGNLARLCRFHHRLKTHGDWHYQRLPDHGLLWTAPTGQRFRVDHTGTTAA